MKPLYFDSFIDRKMSYSAKWDLRSRGVNHDVIPLSVADMDLPTSVEIINSIQKANYGIYGYTNIPPHYTKIVSDYFLRNYKTKIDENHIIFCPRIIQAISIFIQNFTQTNDIICVLTPSYKPIINAINLNKRKLQECSLNYNKGVYSINFEELERCFKISKVFILISPHNPTGIVWSIDELQKIAKLAEKYNVFIISDDIHADFDFSGNTHIFIQEINHYVKYNSITCTSPTKTFNIPGLEISNLIIPNKGIRDKFKSCLDSLGIHNPNYFSIPTVITAYTKCDNYIKQLKEYINHNKNLTHHFIEHNIPNLTTIKTNGTYLIWVDYKKLGINEEMLKKYLLHSANIEVGWGTDFTKDGNYFFRINVALPRFMLIKCLENMKIALTLLKTEGVQQ